MNSKIISKELLTKYNNLVKTDSILPIKITNFYMKKVLEEIKNIGIGGPLYRSVLPTVERINTKTSIETRDYVEEEKHMPIDGVDYVIRKYDNRLVFIVTDMCFAHCQYCFRTYNSS